MPRGPIDKNERGSVNRTVYKPKEKKSEVRKRNIQTAVPGQRRARNRPNHILDKKEEKAFQSFKIEPNDRILDPITQKLVNNDDLFAEIIYRIALLPISESKDVSIKDTTGLDYSTEEQILNVKKNDNVDITKVTYQTNDQNASGEASMEWINYSVGQHKKKHDKIIRKESEDSFLKMCNPGSNFHFVVSLFA